MNLQDLPARADALIAVNDRRRDSPCYRERAFTTKLRNEASKDWASRMPRPASPGFRYLRRAEWAEVIHRAGLSKREIQTLVQVIHGSSMQAIATQERISRQAVHTRFLRIAEKIRAAYAVYPYAGLATAYESQVQRGVSRRNLR